MHVFLSYTGRLHQTGNNRGWSHRRTSLFECTSSDVMILTQNHETQLAFSDAVTMVSFSYWGMSWVTPILLPLKLQCFLFLDRTWVFFFVFIFLFFNMKQKILWVRRKMTPLCLISDLSHTREFDWGKLHVGRNENICALLTHLKQY